MGVQWATVIDVPSCIGCQACTVACRSVHDTPISVDRTWVRISEQRDERGPRQQAIVNRCQQCADAPCVKVCPTGALSYRPDGVVDLEGAACLGCNLCALACPYDAISTDPVSGVAAKCDLCAHRLDAGLEPACATACPTGAIQVGDSNDPGSTSGGLVRGALAALRRPELGTAPRVIYAGVSAHNLAPRLNREGSDSRVIFDIPRHQGWDWRASLTLWMRGVAAGLFLAPALLLAVGSLEFTGLVWRMIVPMVAGIYVAASGGMHLWEIGQRGRLGLLLRRPNLRSFAVIGGALLLSYGLLLLVGIIATLARLPLHALILVLGVPISLGVVLSAAMLLRDLRGRTLWHSRLLAPRLLVQSLACGAAMILPFLTQLAPQSAPAAAWLMAVCALLTLGFWAWGARNPPKDALGAAAADQMLQGSGRGWTVAAVALMVPGLLAPLLGAWVVPLVLGAILAYDYAFLLAGASMSQV